MVGPIGYLATSYPIRSIRSHRLYPMGLMALGMGNGMKNLYQIVSQLKGNPLYSVLLLSLRTPIEYIPEEGESPKKTGFLAFVVGRLFGDFHFEPVDQYGAQLSVWKQCIEAAIPGNAHGWTLGNETMLDAMVRVLGPAGFMMDEAAFKEWASTPCDCGNCDPEGTIEGLMEALANFREQGYTDHSATKVNANTHPENVKATSTVPAVDLPEDPFPASN